jgi:hypothetical protein
MEFTLFYKGNVLSSRQRNAGTYRRVHPIRQEFHRQLKRLWDLPPLCCHHKDWRENTNSKLRQRGKDNQFVWLVTNRLAMYAKLDIQALVYRKDRGFKDIDNKLKTVCDALRKPKRNELRKGWQPERGERPFFCLLEDDESVYQIAVDTDFLLCKPTGFRSKADESMWIINVKIKGNRSEFDKEKDGADYRDLLV